MLNIEEINKTILDLEKHDTTYAACERLAWLYIVKDHLTARQNNQPKMLSVSGDSEFLQAVNGRDSAAAWEIMDELMDTLKVVNTKVYDNVLRKLREL